MDPVRKLSEQRYSRVLQYLSENESTILAAHEALGIPMEDLIAGAARRALTVRASEAGTQLNLTFAGVDQAPEKGGQS